VRDARLDFWRGLCLLDMVLVHLVYEGVWLGAMATPIVGSWTRFAAGGFVLVAGIGVAQIFGPSAADPATRPAAHRRLVRRAAQLLGAHYAAAALFVLLDVSLARRVAPADPAALLLDLALLRELPPYGDILPLYVLLLAASPFLLSLVRRGYGLALALGSSAAFAAGMFAPWVLSPSAGQSFPPLLWQAPFVAGLLASPALSRWHAHPARYRRRVLAGLWLGAGALSWLAHAPPVGAGTAWHVGLFEKTPLGPGELLRYLGLTFAVLLTTSEIWSRIARASVARAVAVLGRHSLPVYVAHVFVQATLLAAAARLGVLGHFDAWIPLASFSTLYGVARLLEAAKARRSGWRSGVLGSLRGFGAPPAGLAAAAACSGVFALLSPGPALEPPRALGADGPRTALQSVADAALDGGADRPVLDLGGEDAPSGAYPEDLGEAPEDRAVPLGALGPIPVDRA